MSEFYESCPTDAFSATPNVDAFKYDTLKEKILEAVESFQCAPFTIQRICELITSPKKHYKRTDKFMRGLEKNILVVSTIDPSILRCSEVNNNGNLVVNGVLEISAAELLPNSSSSCLESNFLPSTIVNGTSEDNNNSPATASSPSSTSTMFAATHHPASTSSTNPESESSSSSDSDSSTDSSSNAEYPKPAVSVDSVVDSSSNASTTGIIPPIGPVVVAPAIPMIQEATEFVASSDGARTIAMDTTPEEGVSSSDVQQQIVATEEFIDGSSSSSNTTIGSSISTVVADSTDENVSRSTDAFIIAKSGVDDPAGLSLGDELSVVKEVAENLVETLLNQSESGHQMALLPDEAFVYTSSVVDPAVVMSEVTSLCLNVVADVDTQQFEVPTDITAQVDEKSENMETDLLSTTEQASSSTSVVTVATCSTPLLSPCLPPVDSTSEVTVAIETDVVTPSVLLDTQQQQPDQSEPMDED